MADKTALVSGGGIVGAAAALALAKREFEVELVDPQPPKPVKGRLGVDPRTVALSPASIDWLRELVPGLSLPCSAVSRMHVWERTGTGVAAFDARDAEFSELAFIFEHSTLAHALWSHASRVARVTMCPISGLSGARQVTFSDGRVAHPSVVIVAEGARSSTRDLIGVGQRSCGPEGIAISTAVRSECAHGNLAIQRFAEGPIALLPMHEDHLLSLIWSVPDELGHSLLRMSDQEFLCRANAETEEVCGRLIELDRRTSFPIFQRVVKDFLPLPRVALVGDAARTIHPLAGFGVNLGLEDVRSLVAAMNPSSGPDALDGTLLAWSWRRQLRSQIMVALMWSFSSLWSVRNPYSVWLRNLGVKWFDGSGPFKKQVIREAVGKHALGQLI